MHIYYILETINFLLKSKQKDVHDIHFLGYNKNDNNEN